MSACLAEAYLHGAYLDGVRFEEAILANERGVGPHLLDVRWGTTNLSNMSWEQVAVLGEDYWALQKKNRDGKKKANKERMQEYQGAVRVNRQLATALQDQGLNEEAARFAYRSQILQWHVSWFQMLQRKAPFGSRIKAFGALLFSWFLLGVAGYGYRIKNSLATYVGINAVFALLYHQFDPSLSWLGATVVSLLSFHGRGFASSTFSPGDPTSIISAVEAFVGLVVEVTLIATLTRRFFSR